MSLNELAWKSFLAPQEEMLLGSTPKAEYADNWYTPMLVQDGWDVRIVEYVRQRLGTFEGIVTYFEDLEGNPLKINVESPTESIRLSFLDLESGEMLRDPVPVREDIILRDTERLKFRS